MSSNPQMKHLWALVVIAVIACSTAIVGTSRFIGFWVASDEALPAPNPEVQQFEPAPPPDPSELDTVATKNIDPTRLLGGSLVVVKRMAEITPACMNILQSSFVRDPRSKVEKVPFGDPGEDFEVSDAIRGGLPFRRLGFAGLGTATCFVYYERRPHVPFIVPGHHRL